MHMSEILCKGTIKCVAVARCSKVYLFVEITNRGFDSIVDTSRARRARFVDFNSAKKIRFPVFLSPSQKLRGNDSK